MKKNYFLASVSLSALLVISNVKYSNAVSHQLQDSLLTVKLSFTGDLMCHLPQIDYARTEKDSFDFKPYFEEVKNYLSDADATFGNFETVVAGGKAAYSGYPNFNSPEEYLEALHNSGFGILFTSNNHSLDKGVKGILSTIEKVKQNNMIPIGTHFSKVDRDSVRIIDIKGFRIGINSYTYGLNGYKLPSGKGYFVNLIDTSLIRSDIEKIKSKDPDIVLIYFHFGEEYSRKPSAYQKEIVAKTFEYGADVIIASHPHVIQPVEYYQKSNGKLAKGLIAYSLGNFFSNQQWRYSDAGAILNLEITKNILKDSLWINEVSLMPTWVFKGNVSDKKTFRILPVDTTFLKSLPTYLKENEMKKLAESFKDTREMFLLK